MVKLREHLQAQINAVDKRLSGAISDRDVRVQAALASAREATVKAEQANDARLGLLNEFRAQAADESRKYALEVVVRAEIESLEKRIGRNETNISLLQGRAIAFAGFGALVGGAVAAAVVKVVGG